MDARLDRIEDEVESMKERMEETHALVTRIHRDLYGSSDIKTDTGLFGDVRNVVDNFDDYQGEVRRMIRDVRVFLFAFGVIMAAIGGNAYYQSVLGGDSLWLWLGRVLGVM